MDRRMCACGLGALLSVAAVAPPAIGCVADVFPLDRLATDSAGAVTATVSAVRSYWTPDHATIETEVTLTGVSRITRDGLAEIADITFTIVGGTVDDATVRICCVPEMHPGERWVLFLQSEYRQSPVLGMERGMFRIQAVDGIDRIASADGHSVVAVNAEGKIERGAALAPEARTEAAAPTPRRTRGGISNVRVVERKEAALADRAAEPAPVTLDAFLAEIRGRLPAARAADAGPIAPARIRPVFTAVPPKSIHEVAAPPEAAQ